MLVFPSSALAPVMPRFRSNFPPYFASFSSLLCNFLLKRSELQPVPLIQEQPADVDEMIQSRMAKSRMVRE